MYYCTSSLITNRFMVVLTSLFGAAMNERRRIFMNILAYDIQNF